MFEKADPVSAAQRPPFTRRTEERAWLRRGASGAGAERFDSRATRRAGEALRAVEWSEITARLNAARDLRLLLRSESQGQIDAVGASFGDAAASYFAMLDDREPAINLDGLDRSKGRNDNECARVAIRHEAVSGGDADRATGAPGGDARDKQ
jgi:hypothetical protein